MGLEGAITPDWKEEGAVESEEEAEEMQKEAAEMEAERSLQGRLFRWPSSP